MQVVSSIVVDGKLQFKKSFIEMIPKKETQYQLSNR